MEKKLIVLDIDGTLTKGNEPLSPKAKEVLSKLVKEGHEVVFASGRPIRAILPHYESIDCHSPIIAYNGLWTHRPLTLGKKPGYCFKKEDVQKIYDKVKGKVTSFMAESETTIYSLIHDDYLDMFFPYKGMKEVTGHSLTFKEDLLTVLFKSSKENEKYIEEAISAYPEYGFRRWTNSPYSELYKIGIDKGFGVKLIQHALGISKENTIAIGDSDNDFTMLQTAKTAYAIKGSKSKKLLSFFKTTDKSLAENGAVLVLEELLLSK